MIQEFNNQDFAGADSFFDDSQNNKKKSFDFVLWFYRILKYWYLFVISLILFMGYAYLKNRSWIPVYQTSSILMLESRGTSGVAMGGVPLGSVVRNTINQQLVLKSYDMIAHTIDLLPQMKVDYFTQNKFKVTNLYGQTPISIDCQYVAPSAYNFVFTIAPINADKCRIYYKETDNTPGFSVEVPYGEYVQESKFYIRVNKTIQFASDAQFAPFNFRFVSRNELIGRYANSVSSNLIAEKSTALRVSVMGTNRQQDNDFLNALLAQFQNYNLQLKNEAVQRAISFYDKQLFMLQDSLKISESALRNYQEETGLYNISTSGDIVSKADLDKTTDDLVNLKVQESTLLLVTEEINKAIGNNQELADPSSLGLSDPELSKFVSSYNAQLDRFKRMGTAFPLYKKAEQDIYDMQTKILETLIDAQAKLQAAKEDAKEKRSELENKMSTLPNQMRTYSKFQSEYDVNAKYVQYLQNKKREANFQEKSNIPDNYVLEQPRSGGAINGGETSSRYSYFFFLGLIIPLVLIVCKEEFLNFSIATKEECERISGLPVIGTIENISKKIASSGSTATLVKNFPKSSFAESFRNMRIRIEYMAQRESPIVVLVTSSEPADGKTFIAANVASIYQLTGKKVILVDFDLRRPSVSNMLKLQARGGVSNYLIGQLKLDDVIITHPEYGFDIIPAGTLPPNPSELIKTLKTKDLIEHLKSEYDYVIIDCSPVGLVSDALVLSKHVDTTLFVVRRAKTNRSFFKSVVNQIRNDGLHHAAIVFNDVKGREGYYGTSRYYGDKSYYLKHNSYYHDDYFDK